MWIHLPILALLILVFAIFLVTLVLRVKAVQAKTILVYDMFQLNKSNFPNNIQLLGNSYDNQFQMPLLFICALFFTEIDTLDARYWQITAWIFVGARYWHCFEHLIAKNLLRRTLAFVISTVTLFVYWFSLIIHFSLSSH